MGKQKVLKPAQKLKDCIGKTYKVELQSSASELYENNKEDMFVLCHMFVSCHVSCQELKAVIKRSTFYIELIQILTHSPFRKRIKEFGVFNLVMKSRALSKGHSRAGVTNMRPAGPQKNFVWLTKQSGETSSHYFSLFLLINNFFVSNRFHSMTKKLCGPLTQQ